MAKEATHRYERKFVAQGLDRAQIEAMLLRHPALFYQPYPPRFVNNIYLDTIEFNNYGDNLAGAAERTKIRLRWYHDLFRLVDDGILEFKIKQGLVGWKEQYDFPPFTFQPGFAGQDFLDWVAASSLPPEVKLRLMLQRPCLVNRYLRAYFATRDGRFRVTVDTDLVYYKVNRLSNRFLVRQEERDTLILELKYDHANSRGAARISSRFPLRLSRSSKYAHGVETFYLWGGA
ncbi:MAG: VTC domain-containing protein [Anaerolineales bacterium]|jgi:hypothetical protein